MNFFQKIPLFFFSILYPLKVYGKENIPSGACIFACNHFRAIDCGFIVNAHNKDISFLAKKELFKNRLIAKIVSSYGAIPVDRDNPDVKSIISALKVLKSGHKLCIFPEGTRNKTGTTILQDLKSGTMIFAVKAKCPVVPMMLSGKAKLFRKTKLFIGKPFDLSEFYDKKLTDEDLVQMSEILKSKMISVQQELVNSTTKKGMKSNKKWLF